MRGPPFYPSTLVVSHPLFVDALQQQPATFQTELVLSNRYAAGTVMSAPRRSTEGFDVNDDGRPC